MMISPLLQFDGKLLDGLDFCSKVYALFESIRSVEDGVSRLRLRPTRLEKRLLEELLPICNYVQTHYRPGRYISIRWIDGNQQYDAEVVQCGAYVTENYYPANAHLEVTCTMHRNEHLSRELLETKGGGFGLEGMHRLKDGEIESLPVGYKNKEFIDSYANLLLKQIAKKERIAYPAETTLIVQCTLNTLYMADEWETLISQVRAGLSKSSFREVYLYDTVCHYSQSLWPHRDA